MNLNVQSFEALIMDGLEHGVENCETVGVFATRC